MLSRRTFLGGAAAFAVAAGAGRPEDRLKLREWRLCTGGCAPTF